MRIYITGKIESKNGQDILMSAVAIDGRLFKLETPFRGEQTYHDVVYKVMKKTEDYIINAEAVKQKDIRAVRFHTDYFGDDYHKAANEACRDEKIYNCMKQIDSTLRSLGIWLVDGTVVNNLEIDRVKDTLMQRVFNPKTEQTYHFKPDDLVIGCNSKSPTHSIYARVVSVDKKNNRLVLDKYNGCGEINIGSDMPNKLLEMELLNYYRPQTDDETLTFQIGIAKLLKPRPNFNRIESRNLDTAEQTYEIVSEAAGRILYEKAELECLCL
jgi:type IV secretory pathway VirB4 component